MTQTLTREQVLKATGSDLNILVAIHIFNERVHPLLGAMMISYSHSKSFYFIPDYSGKIEYAWATEEKIKEMRLQVAYCQALKQVVIGTGEYVGLFDYIHATPEQRCKAALLAVLDI